MSHPPSTTNAHRPAATLSTQRWSVARILPWHIAGVALLQATSMALQFMLPLLARKQFAATDLQTALITAATTALFCLSIFWNDLFARMRVGRYLLLYWAIFSLPMAAIGLLGLSGHSISITGLITLHLIACLGLAGYHPAAGDLLRGLYPAATRGRVYALVWGVSMTLSALLGYALGAMLKTDPTSYRWLLPLGSLLQLLGIAVLTALAYATGHEQRRTLLADGQTLYQRVVEPITHMREVLKTDNTFLRYEAAYMTYGIGWMVAYALLPIMLTDHFKLPYDQSASSTHVPYLLAMILMIYPAGLLMDRLGAIRSTGLSFAMLTIYPLGLIWAGSAHDLALVSALYGIAHAGASVGWMLGPVSLAPTQAKVPQYVAIHATLVGIRGLLFQFLGVGLYLLARSVFNLSVHLSFALPLLLAASAYAWSGVQMWRLDRRVRTAPTPPIAPAP